MLIFSVGFHLVEHFSFKFESIPRPDMLQGIDNLLAVRVLLVAELVCWEGQHSKLIRVLLAKFIHLREVSDSCSSQGGGVLHQDHLPLVLLHADHLPCQLLGLQIVEARHGFN